MNKLDHTCQNLKTLARCSLLSNEWQGALYSQKSRTCLKRVNKYPLEYQISLQLTKFFFLSKSSFQAEQKVQRKYDIQSYVCVTGR